MIMIMCLCIVKACAYMHPSVHKITLGQMRSRYFLLLLTKRKSRSRALPELCLLIICACVYSSEVHAYIRTEGCLLLLLT